MTLTDDKQNNSAGVTTTPKEVVHQRLRGHIEHAFLLPLRMEPLRPKYKAREDKLTASIRFLLDTSPVNSAASLPGIPQVLWQASICCATSGFEGATKTTFPEGNQR